MLENIKSSFMIKMIFLYVCEDRKLQLIRHNKRIQKIMNISHINYKEKKLQKMLKYYSKRW